MPDYSRVDTLVEHLDHLRVSALAADVQFIVGTATGSGATSNRTHVPGHAQILAVRCHRLRARIVEYLASVRARAGEGEGEGNRKKQDKHERKLEIALPTHDIETVKAVLRFVYTGSIALDVDDALPVYELANELGVHRLMEIVELHLDTVPPGALLQLIADAHRRGFKALTAALVARAGRCAREVLAADSLLDATATPAAIDMLVRHEDLEVGEDMLWNAVLKWAYARCALPIPTKISSIATPALRALLVPLARPGRLRILDLEPEYFARVVEPLQIMPKSESLLKWRFDAAVMAVADNELVRDEGFPLGREEFLARVRRRALRFESEHPHECGVRFSKHVQLPPWATKARFEFDDRCELGKYAELAFFSDDECSQNGMCGILTDTRREKYTRHKLSIELENGFTMKLNERSFWYSFYTPRNFKPNWGYRFIVHPL